MTIDAMRSQIAGDSMRTEARITGRQEKQPKMRKTIVLKKSAFLGKMSSNSCKTPSKCLLPDAFRHLFVPFSCEAQVGALLQGLQVAPIGPVILDELQLHAH